MNNQINNWELEIDESKLKEKKDYNLQELYNHAHSELSLQQSKRDQIITIYLALCSFLVPFTLGEAIITWPIKGLIFAMTGIVGILFSFVSIRYREYKEVYWLCCQSITVLKNFKEEEINKDTIQKVFYRCLYKKGHKFVQEDKFDYFGYVKKNLFSSETTHFIIISLIASFVFGMGVAISLPVDIWLKVIIGVIAVLPVLIFLLYVYFSTCIKCYKLLAITDAEEKDKLYSRVFGKAWFLHMYY